MEKLMASSGNAAADPMAHFFGRQKKIMEINPNHPLMEGLLSRLSAGEPTKEMEADVKLLYDAALMHSGYELKNPASFAHRVEDMIRAKYGVEPLSEESKKEAEAAEEDSGPADPMDAFANMGNMMGGMGGNAGMGGSGMNMDDFNFDDMPDFNAPADHSHPEGDADAISSEPKPAASEGEKDEL